MSELQKQIRDHYDARSLPPEKVEAILANGRAAAAGETVTQIPVPTRATGSNRWLFALAAAVAILAGVGAFWMIPRGVDYANLRPTVIAFLAHEPKYPLVSADPEKLHQWALANGAPAGFKIPARLQALPGKGCTILNVNGKPAYLLCFMTVNERGQQDGEMVHLLVARRSDFRGVPKTETPSIYADGQWNFASWVEGDIVYTVAAPASVEKIRSYVFAPTTDVRTFRRS